MSDFFTWLASSTVATNALIVSFSLVVFFTTIIYVIAFAQGREISFWPPKIGTKPSNNKLVESQSKKTTEISLVAREAQLSNNQRDLLRYIERENAILINQLYNVFNKYGGEELFYRLEHLRLLGFITIETIGKSNTSTQTQIYRLSEKYQAERKEIEGDPKGFYKNHPIISKNNQD